MIQILQSDKKNDIDDKKTYQETNQIYSDVKTILLIPFFISVLSHSNKHGDKKPLLPFPEYYKFSIASGYICRKLH